jgi:ABC-type nitrate/sulfonate/bicarbonate transport system substrate-binding protein
MHKTSVVLLTLFVLQTSVHAADKIRIGVPQLAVQFITLPLAEKRGFLKEEGLEAEMIRISGSPASAALLSRELDYSVSLLVGSQLPVCHLGS